MSVPLASKIYLPPFGFFSCSSFISGSYVIVDSVLVVTPISPYKTSLFFVVHRQTVQIQIRCNRMQGLMKFSTVCLQNVQLKFEYIEDIQMFLLNMSFISRVKWTIFMFHEWRSHE